MKKLDFVKGALRAAKTRELRGAVFAAAKLVVKAIEEKLPLISADKLDLAETAKIIATAFGRPVTRIICVSAQSEVDGAALWQDIDESLRDRLHYRHSSTLWEGFARGKGRPGIDKAAGNDLADVIERTVGQAAVVVVDAKMRHGFNCELRRAVSIGFDRLVFTCLGFLANGNSDRAAAVLPVLGLACAKAIPLGQKRNEPATWYVLTA